ncbi:MAG: YcxB family protein [Opitutales bacterium]
MQRRIVIGRVLLPLICLLLAGLFSLDGDWSLSLAFLIPGILFAVFMPCLIKAQHLRHFRNHIREKCQGLLAVEAALRIEEEGLRSKSQDGEGLIKYSGIESLVELEVLYLIKLKQSMTLIVPKSCLPENELRPFMERVAEKSALTLADHRDKPWAESIMP